MKHFLFTTTAYLILYFLMEQNDASYFQFYKVKDFLHELYKKRLQKDKNFVSQNNIFLKNFKKSLNFLNMKKKVFFYIFTKFSFVRDLHKNCIVW